MRHFPIFTAVAAILAATAQGTDLLDDVLAGGQPAKAQKEEAPQPTLAPEASAINEGDAKSPTSETMGAGEFDNVENFDDAESINAGESRKHIVNPTTFYLRGGGSRESSAVSGELTRPIGNSAFDINFRGFCYQVEKQIAKTEKYYTFHNWYSRGYGWHTSRISHTRINYHSVNQINTGGEAFCIWRPFREKRVSPYFGLGLRYENVENDLDKGDDGGASAAARIGVSLDLRRVFITGEYIAGSESKEIIGDLSFYISRRCKLHAFVESIDVDINNGFIGGGGLSFDF